MTAIRIYTISGGAICALLINSLFRGLRAVRTRNDEWALIHMVAILLLVVVAILGNAVWGYR